MRLSIVSFVLILSVVLLGHVPSSMGQQNVLIEATPAIAVDNEAVAEFEIIGQGIVPQVRQMLLAELVFVQHVCQLTKEQRIPIAQGGQASVKLVVKKYGEVQLAMQRGQFQWNANNGSPYPNSRKLLRESLLELVKKHTSKEQFERYEVESKKRDEVFKRVVVLAFVAKLDNDLILSEGQREKLVAMLLANYMEKWCESLDILAYGDQAYPSLPAELITPILEEKQKQVWQDSQIQNSVFWGFMAINNVVVQPDTDWSDLIGQANGEATGGANPPTANADVGEKEGKSPPATSAEPAASSGKEDK